MRNTRKSLSPVAVALLTVLLATSACGGSDNTPRAAGKAATRSEAVAQVTDEVILPGLNSSTSSAKSLEASLIKLCSSPDDANLDAARRSWRGARKAWMETSAYRVGPIGELRSRAKIAYPIDVAKLQALLADGQVDPNRVDELGAHLRGLGGIEYVLFTTKDAAALKPASCSYARAASTSVKDGATELERAWTDGYSKKFRDGGQDAIDELVNASLGSLSMVDDTTLGEPADEVQGAAENGLADGIAELESVEAVWGEPPHRLAGLVRSISRSAAEGFTRPLKAAVTSLKAADSLEDSSAKAAAEQVDKARVVLRTEVSSQLGVTITFNDSDGDG